MDKSKIILRLQQIASTSSDSYELKVLAKAVEKLQVGTVSVVSTAASLPAAASSLVGEVYLVENDDDLYVNIGSQWNSLNNELSSVAYAWGYNGFGRLGDGTSTDRSSPVTVIGGITNWAQVSAGGRHILGVTTTGIAYGWGGDTSIGGRLGDGTTTNRSSPVTVVGGLTWKQVVAGGLNSLGVTTTGIAYGWGNNTDGQLGNGTITSSNSPVSVIGGITNWSQVSTGASHSLGVTTTGIAYGWGSNGSGRLGNGTTTATSSPVSVIGGITNWTQVSAGASFSMGLTSTGIAYAWGYNTQGQLGDGTTISKNSPVTVVGGITNWRQVSAGYASFHSLGVTTTGIAYGWGYNGQGQLGNGTITSSRSPVTVIGGITNWSQVSGGSNHSLGVTSTGIAYGWGFNNRGRLGDGTTTNRSSPVSVIGGITNWSSVSAGGTLSAATISVLKSR